MRTRRRTKPTFDATLGSDDNRHHRNADGSRWRVVRLDGKLLQGTPDESTARRFASVVNAYAPVCVVVEGGR